MYTPRSDAIYSLSCNSLIIDAHDYLGPAKHPLLSLFFVPWCPTLGEFTCIQLKAVLSEFFAL